jgi:hypothetical protein
MDEEPEEEEEEEKEAWLFANYWFSLGRSLKMCSCRVLTP